MGNSDSPKTNIINLNSNSEKISQYFDKSINLNNENSISEKKHKCTYDGCQAVFRRPSRLTWHIRQHTGERPYKCTFATCDKAYATSSHLKRHLQSHEPITTSYVCTICSMILKTRQNLQKHFQRTHNNKNRLSCDKCGAVFRKKCKLDEHVAAHNGIFYNCSKCNGKFSTINLLEKHTISSHTKRIYTCTRKGCFETFNLWRDMLTHRKNDHVGEYKCDVCEKIFLTKVHLKNHLTSHTEDSFLACPYEKCPKFYTQQRNLNVHIRSKHLNIKFTCDICKVGLTSKDILRRHIMTIHQSKIKPRNTKKGNRQRRKDAGTRNKSILGKLVGLNLPIHVEKELIARETKVAPLDIVFSDSQILPIS